MSAAASVVSQALEDLLQHVRQYTSRGEPIGRYDQATDTIMTVTESIFSSMGDAGGSQEIRSGEWKSYFRNRIQTNTWLYYVLLYFDRFTQKGNIQSNSMKLA